MRMPRSIRIGTYTLKVQRPRTCGYDIDDHDREVLADYSFRRKVIQVQRGVSEPLAQDLLLHEIGHAAWEYSHLHMHTTLGRYEERVVQALMQTLLDILRSNPMLVAYLMEKT